MDVKLVWFNWQSFFVELWTVEYLPRVRARRDVSRIREFLFFLEPQNIQFASNHNIIITYTSNNYLKSSQFSEIVTCTPLLIVWWCELTAPLNGKMDIFEFSSRRRDEPWRGKLHLTVPSATKRALRTKPYLCFRSILDEVFPLPEVHGKIYFSSKPEWVVFTSARISRRELSTFLSLQYAESCTSEKDASNVYVHCVRNIGPCAFTNCGNCEVQWCSSDPPQGLDFPEIFRWPHNFKTSQRTGCDSHRQLSTFEILFSI